MVVVFTWGRGEGGGGGGVCFIYACSPWGGGGVSDTRITDFIISIIACGKVAGDLFRDWSISVVNIN